VIERVFEKVLFFFACLASELANPGAEHALTRSFAVSQLIYKSVLHMEFCPPLPGGAVDEKGAATRHLTASITIQEAYT